MNSHKVLFLVAATLLGSCQDDLPSRTAQGKITLEVSHSLKIQNNRVGISVSGNQLSVTRQNYGNVPMESAKELTSGELEALWKSVDAVNWKKVERDKVNGLDGSTYRVEFGGRKLEVWSPHSNTSERGLAELIGLKTFLWKVAGVTGGEDK